MSRASATSWSEKHKQVIEQCLESEEAFRTYLTDNTSNVRRAYTAFIALVRLFSKSTKQLKPSSNEAHNELAEAKHSSIQKWIDTLSVCRDHKLISTAGRPKIKKTVRWSSKITYYSAPGIDSFTLDSH